MFAAGRSPGFALRDDELGQPAKLFIDRFEEWLGENDLVWNEVIKGLKLQFNYNNNTQIHAYHDLILSKHLLKRIYKQIIRKRAFEEVKKDIYEGLTYYLIYYPILYALESKNIYILHGSAVTYNDKAILMPGLPGVGKSTLCMALLSNKNSKFLSDNIVLYDDNKIYACFEPIRLDENSISLMPDKGQKIINMHIQSCYSRGSYKVKENETLQQISPDITKCWAVRLRPRPVHLRHRPPRPTRADRRHGPLTG